MDYPSLGFDHGETIDMLRESIRHFAASEIAPVSYTHLDVYKRQVQG